MTCSYCQLAGCCSGIGACAAKTNLFRMARRLLDHHGNPSLVREIQEEAWKLTSHPEILLDEDELKYALLV